jgi:hypothetical protein
MTLKNCITQVQNFFSPKKPIDTAKQERDKTVARVRAYISKYPVQPKTDYELNRATELRVANGLGRLLHDVYGSPLPNGCAEPTMNLW